MMEAGILIGTNGTIGTSDYRERSDEISNLGWAG